MLGFPLLKKFPSEQLSVGRMGCRKLPRGHAISAKALSAKQDSQANRFSTGKFLADLLTQSQGWALLGQQHLKGAGSLLAQRLQSPNRSVSLFAVFQSKIYTVPLPLQISLTWLSQLMATWLLWAFTTPLCWCLQKIRSNAPRWQAALLSEEPPGLIAIKSDTSTAIPRINMSWQSFISNKICVEKKDSVNVSVRKKIVWVAHTLLNIRKSMLRETQKSKMWEVHPSDHAVSPGYWRSQALVALLCSSS